MTVSSLGFAVFVLAVLLVDVRLPERARTGWLLVASYAFYALWSPWFPLVVAALTAANFAVGERMRGAARAKRGWLWTGIALNLAVMFLLRHEEWLGTAGVVGLSFYTLQAVSYLVDTFTGAVRMRPSLTELGLYLAYFPKLLAGPIERARAFVTNVRGRRPCEPEVIPRAVALIAVGVVRKAVIVDQLLALIPDGTFTAPTTVPPSTLLYGVVALVFFVYNDFAGYSDIARGTSLLFGVPLSVNFAQPLFATSFSEFWSRWHVSLSSWLRDYVYMPVSRGLLRRKWPLRSLPMVFLPPMATMLASGLWHGARSGMMLWGALQGAFLVAGRMVRPRREASITRGTARRTLGSVRIFALMAVAFSATCTGTTHFVEFWTSLFRWAPWEAPAIGFCVLLILSTVIDLLQLRSRDELVFLAWPRPVRAGLLALTIVACALTTGDGPIAPFVYQAF